MAINYSTQFNGWIVESTDLMGKWFFLVNRSDQES